MKGEARSYFSGHVSKRVNWSYELIYVERTQRTTTAHSEKMSAFSVSSSDVMSPDKVCIVDPIVFSETINSQRRVLELLGHILRVKILTTEIVKILASDFIE